MKILAGIFFFAALALIITAVLMLSGKIRGKSKALYTFISAVLFIISGAVALSGSVKALVLILSGSLLVSVLCTLSENS